MRIFVNFIDVNISTPVLIERLDGFNQCPGIEPMMISGYIQCMVLRRMNTKLEMLQHHAGFAVKACPSLPGGSTNPCRHHGDIIWQ